MSSAQLAALRDYPRRVRFPLTLTLSGMLFLPVLIGGVKGKDWAGELGFLGGSLFVIVWTGLVSGHLKQVLARPQGRLLPRYARIQVEVGLALTLPGLLLAALGIRLAGHALLPSVTIPALLFAFYWSWPYLFDRGNLLILFGPSLIWQLSLLANDPGYWGSAPFLSAAGRETLTWVVLLAVSILVVAFVVRRMLHLDESRFEYRRDPSIGWRRGTSPDSDAPLVGIFRRLLPWFGRYRIVAGLRVYRSGFPTRVGHWRRGMGPTSPMITGLTMAGMVAIMGVFFLFYDERKAFAETLILLIYLMMFPFSRYSYSHRRRERLESEAMFPVARRRLVWEFGAATAIDILLTWAFLCLGTLGLRALGLFPTVAWSSFLYYLVVTLGSTLFGLGLVPWVLRLNGDKWPSFVISFAAMAVGLAVALTLRGTLGLRLFGVWAIAAACLAAFGAMGAWQGLQFWSRMELGRKDF